jgi:hypothetical protein
MILDPLPFAGSKIHLTNHQGLSAAGRQQESRFPKTNRTIDHTTSINDYGHAIQ